MTSGDRTDLTIPMPMMINTFLGCLASAFWAFYAWVFDPKQPNYFMVSNYSDNAIYKRSFSLFNCN
jgi:hypothetical protein